MREYDLRAAVDDKSEIKKQVFRMLLWFFTITYSSLVYAIDINSKRAYTI